MCGIAGIFWFGEPFKINDEEVLSMLHHRGPDACAKYESRYGKLYHSRLSIVDTSSESNQPYPSGKSPSKLVYNGEIFNFQSLGKDLSLTTSGDTEVVYKLLSRKGISALREMNGFFSLAYLDETNGSLIVTRDRLGVKPLYYIQTSDYFAFASELKPLMAIIGPRRINRRSLYQYFRLNYCSGDESIFEGVKRMEPGSALVVKGGQVSVDKWYRAEPAKDGNLFRLLDDAVRLRLHADVPLGSFLSGGLDSSIISALAARHHSRLNTFSVGFKEHSFYDESDHAALVSRHIGSVHHEIMLDGKDFAENAEGFFQSIDEPFADSSAFNFYLLSRYTSGFVKVALSGDGADELFKGYQKHRALILAKRPTARMAAKVSGMLLPEHSGGRHGWLANRLRQLKKLNRLAEGDENERQLLLASISGNEDVCRILHHADNSDFRKLLQVPSRFRGLDIDDAFDLAVVLPDDMLVKADRFSMRHGLEVRNPFLDYRIVEYALGLKTEQKIRRKEQKIPLRETFGKLLPKQILDRSKKGFELPLAALLAQPLQGYVSELESSLQDLPEINALEVKKLISQGGRGDSAARLWAVLIYKHWKKNFGKFIASE